MFKANNKDTRMTLPLFGLNMQIYKVNHHVLFKYERRHSNVFIINFEYISHTFLVFGLLTLNKCMFACRLKKNLKLTTTFFISPTNAINVPVTEPTFWYTITGITREITRIGT